MYLFPVMNLDPVLLNELGIYPNLDVCASYLVSIWMNKAKVEWQMLVPLFTSFVSMDCYHFKAIETLYNKVNEVVGFLINAVFICNNTCYNN